MEAGGCVKAPHALLLPYPLQGHVTPFMELGKRLASLGVRVTLATTHHVHAKLLRAQQALSHPISTRHLNFTLVGVSDGLPPLFDRDHASKELMQAFDHNLEDPTLELVHTLSSQGFPVTCIVSAFFLRWTSSLARRARLPEFVYWPQCAVLFSIYVHMDALICTGYNPFDTNVSAAAPRPDPMEIVTCIPGLPHQIRYADLPFQGSFWKQGVEWIQAVQTHRFGHLGEAHGVVLNSFEALEPEACKALNGALQQLMINNKDAPTTSPSVVQLIGPLTSMGDEGSGASLWEEEVEECRQWLDGQPLSSVVFVAFGSVATMSCIEQVQELASGLIASGQRFLWVLRKNAIHSMEDVELQDALPLGFLDQIQHIGKVVRWAPQALVLSHPSVAGFFSHCGWNSVIESISIGVPILAWPSSNDQFTNARLVSHVWKVGLALECNADNQTTKEQVENGLKQLMEGPHTQHFRTCVMKLKHLAQEALHNSSHLLSFADDICKMASSSSVKHLITN